MTVKKEIKYFFWKHPHLNQIKYITKAVGHICCCPFLYCFWITRDDKMYSKRPTWRMDYSDPKEREMLTIKYQHQEQKLKRRKSLSAGIGRHRETSNQAQSALFAKLPAEIRLTIYSFVLNAEPSLHIKLGSEGVGIWGFADQGRDAKIGSDPSMEHLLWDWYYFYESNHSYPRDDYGDSPRLGALPLLTSCRMIYTEAIDVLYSGNTFNVAVGDDFKAFAQSIPRRHLQAIRSLRLYISERFVWPSSPEWREVLSILERMTGLRDCTISITTFQEFSAPVTELAFDFAGSLEQFPNRDAIVVDVIVFSTEDAEPIIIRCSLIKRFIAKDEE